MQSIKKINDKNIMTILNEVTDRTKKIYGNQLQKVVLFGSYARHEQDDESDIDIMLLVNEKQENLKKYHKDILDIIVDLSLKYDIVLSIMEQEYNQFINYKEFIPFYANVNNEGVEVYDRQ